MCSFNAKFNIGWKTANFSLLWPLSSYLTNIGLVYPKMYLEIWSLRWLYHLNEPRLTPLFSGVNQKLLLQKLCTEWPRNLNHHNFRAHPVCVKQFANSQCWVKELIRNIFRANACHSKRFRVTWQKLDRCTLKLIWNLNTLYLGWLNYSEEPP